MLPTAQAGYGEVRKFLRNPPKGLDHAKIWDVYNDAVFDPPGRVCSFFTLQGGMNYLDSSKSLIIGVVGFGTDPWVTDHKTAREEYEKIEAELFIGDWQITLEVTPLRYARYRDADTGEVDEFWEWRMGATFKRGELEELIGLGTHHFRQVFYYDGELWFDTDWFGLPFDFTLV